MTLAEFIAKYSGKFIDTDGMYGPQCFDLIHQYLLEIYGLPLADLAAPSASDLFDKF